MKLEAVKALRYAGESIPAGGTFEPRTERDRKILVGIGKAKPYTEKSSPDYQTKVVKAEDPDEKTKPRKTKRQYKRRDMKAED